MSFVGGLNAVMKSQKTGTRRRPHLKGTTPLDHSFQDRLTNGVMRMTLRARIEPIRQVTMCTMVRETGYIHPRVLKMYLLRMTVLTLAPNQPTMIKKVLMLPESMFETFA